MHRSIRGKRILLMGQHCQCLNGWVCYRDHLFFFFFFSFLWSMSKKGSTWQYD